VVKPVSVTISKKIFPLRSQYLDSLFDKIRSKSLFFKNKFCSKLSKIFHVHKHMAVLILVYLQYLGASVAEWLLSLTSNHLPRTAVGSNPTGTLDSFMWGSYPASLRNVGGLLMCPFMPEIMHRRAPEVFLRQ
jgi:hypothetical protein